MSDTNIGISAKTNLKLPAWLVRYINDQDCDDPFKDFGISVLTVIATLSFWQANKFAKGSK